MSKHTLHTIIRILLLPVFTAVAVCTAAQKDAVPYECGFEQADAECGNWVLNYNPAVTGWSNRWYIGGAVAAEGAQSMYIRPSAIDSAKYVSKENTMLAWRVFDLPYGDYNVAFDWMAMGFNGARLLVSWVDNEANLQRIVSVNSGYLAPEILDSCHISDADGIALDSLCGSGVWQRAFTTVHSDGTKRYKLIFAWYNSGQGRPVPPAACIDNIEIVEVGCSHPQNLKATVSGATAELSWQADADSYDVWYRRHGQTNWTKRTSATNSFRLPGQVNGIYEVKVRAHCGDKTSVWSATKRVLVYSGLCLDYLDLDAAECRSGLVAEVVKGGGTPGVVDHGFESGVSRHTLHFMPGETDPRTDGILPTVPPGEIASVRLGNWGEKPRAHGESVTYRYPVDASVAKLLLLKYAVVFQRPDPDHDRNAQPHFRLRIFNDKTGEQVDPDCAGAEFYAGYGSGADWITIDRSSPTATQKDILEVKP